MAFTSRYLSEIISNNKWFICYYAILSEYERFFSRANYKVADIKRLLDGNIVKAERILHSLVKSKIIFILYHRDFESNI